MSHRIVAATALALVSAGVLTGCSFVSSDLDVLDSDRQVADELPILEDYSYDEVDEPSSRYVGEHDGISLWVARGTESPACLVAVGEDADEWLVACGGLPLRMSGLDHAFELRPDGAPAPEGGTRVSDNVYAD